MPDLDLQQERELTGHAACSRAYGAAMMAGSKPHPLAGDTAHYAPDLVVDVKHIKLEISIDPKAKSIAGTATHTVVAINDNPRSVSFDAVEMRVTKVTVGGKPAKFDYSDPVLKVDLPRMKAGATIDIAINYSAKPRRGLWFTAPDRDYPKKPLQAWSQGQDEDSRHWYPCLDFPNHQQTTEVIVTVPAKMISVGNGELLSVKKRADGRSTYHWNCTTPHVTYLLSQCVGDFAEIEHDWKGVKVQYYGPKGRNADIERTLQRTPQMLEILSDATGLKYPYSRYAQTFVADFIFGGMENITATTLTDTSLLDKRAWLDSDADGLLAHELAHQWFGDLLTCREWAHAWLNEGFATYFEALFTEQAKGIDEFRYELYQNAQIYMGEDSGRYRRPIVHNVYNEPIDIFDRHLYEKGSLVLHMIRTVLGDDLWRKAIHYYVANHKNTNVTTPDLQRSIERATGRTIDWLFDQWVYKGGHPNFKLSFEYDDKSKQAKLNVTQTQDEKDSSIFRMPVVVDFMVDGKKHAFNVEIRDKVHNFFFALPAKPQLVRFDPGNNYLKTVDFKRGKDMLVYQLKNDDDVVGRVGAAKELAKLATQEAVDALKDAVQKDKFWGVQAEAARALGGMRSEIARDALLSCVTVRHPKARRGVVAGLGQFRHDDKVAATLEGILRKGDPSYYVEANAAQSLGQTRTAKAFDVLTKVAMKKESQNDVIRSQTLLGLAELKDERVLPIALDWTKRGKSNPVRGTATAVLPKLANLSDKAKDDVYDRLVELASDDWLRVRLNAIAGLAELKLPKAVAELDRVRVRELDGRVIRTAREAINRIREGADKGDEIKKLREEMEKIQEENRGLKDRLDRLEASAPKAAKTSAARKSSPPRKAPVKMPRRGTTKPRRAAASRAR
jgi:aminopeptidase N